MNKNASITVFKTTFDFFLVYIKPHAINPAIARKYTTVPELNGRPRVFTKNNSKLPAS